MTTAPLRLAIIGCSEVVEHGHAGPLLAHRGFDVVAVVDPVRERRDAIGALVQVEPAQRFGSVTELDHAAIDVALIATPPHVRRRIVEHLAPRGVDVISEKPLSTTLADADAIVHAVRAADRTLVMVHNYPHIDEYRWIIDRLRSGALGGLHTVVFRALGSPGRPGNDAYEPNWRWDAAISGGGRLLDLGIHAVNLADVMFGEPCESVVANVELADSGVDERTHAIFRYPSGTAVCQIGRGYGPAGVDVIGTDGCFSLHFPPRKGSFSISPIRLVEVIGEEERIVGLDTREQFPSAFYDHVERCLRSRDKSRDGSDGRHLLEIVHGAYLAGHLGRAVNFPADHAEPMWQSLHEQGVRALWSAG